jgi:23S rRNA 5-hydroxycytidine C2501 synthase
MTPIELLAPARDKETGLAAINCGADAVYIGAARFGAREAAGNSLEDIRALAAYAHRYWARVYVTINTLLRDEELPQAEILIRELYEAGADALIIQDAGLLELDLPPIPLFASTQMHNHTPARVAFLEKVGIRRAILARELTLDQIRAIRASTSLELEVFVHGALCVSYSGQCYLSCALGGRSGNRGQCAQPCRRPYNLVDRSGAVVVAGRHLLSLKDLNLSGDLGALLDAGVSSFKIEGRLKDRAYVMNVVASYRQKLDALLEKRSLKAEASGRVSFDFIPDPRKTFNRGFTRYFLHGRKEPVGSPDTPKSIGEPLGRVDQVEKIWFSLDGGSEVHRGDGLCYYVPKGGLLGTSVNDVQGRRIFPEKLEGLGVGTLVFRNHDRLFLAALEKSKTTRKIDVRFRLAPSRDGLALFAQDGEGNEGMCALPLERAPAEKADQAQAVIETQLRKLGGTAYECAFIRSDLPEAEYIPLSILNALRRGALESLTEDRLRNFTRRTGKVLKNEVPYPAQALTFEGNVLNEAARAFYRRHGVRQIEPAAESGLDLHGQRVMTTRHCIKHQMGWCKTYPNPKALPSSPPEEPLSLVDEDGLRYPLRFDCARCVMEVIFE